MDRGEIWRNIHEQRRALYDILRSLSEDEWSRQSLCDGWTVRDVAAHVMRSPAVGPVETVRRLGAARGSFNRMVDRDAREAGSRPVAEILASFRTCDGSRRRPIGTSVVDPLLDVLVHTQDIVLPLGRTHPMPVEASCVAARRARSVAFVFGGRRRYSGVTVRASDAALSIGRGPVVEGPVEAILLLLTGRTRAAAPRLSGPGVTRLRL